MHARRPSDPLSATDDRVRRFDSSSSCRDPSSGWPQLTVHAVVQLPNGDDHQSEHSRRPTLPSVATRASGQCGERTRDGARQREPGMNSGTGRPSSGGARTRGVRTFRRLREPVTLEGGVRKRSAARLRVEQPKLGGTGVRERPLRPRLARRCQARWRCLSRWGERLVRLWGSPVTPSGRTDPAGASRTDSAWLQLRETASGGSARPRAIEHRAGMSSGQTGSTTPEP
jgi:hypothetical protein